MGIKTYDKFFQRIIKETLAANQELMGSVRNDKDQDFIITNIYYQSTSASLQFKFNDSASNRGWQDRYINAANGLGTVLLPFKYPVPRIVKANTTIQYWLKDLSGAGNTVEIVLSGYLRTYVDDPTYNPTRPDYNPNVLPDGRVKAPFAYIYDVIKASVSQAEQNIAISSGHEFIVTHITGNRSDVYYNLMIRDSGSNEYWQDMAVRDSNFVGSAIYAYKLPHPRYIKPGSSVFFQVSGSAATSNTIQLVLWGYEIPLRYR